MPNIATVVSVLEGKKEHIENLEKVLTGYLNDKTKIFGEIVPGVLGRVELEYFKVSEAEDENKTLHLITNEAWYRREEFWNAFQKHFNLEEIFYLEEELGNDLYQTNDTGCKYFKHNYFFEIFEAFEYKDKKYFEDMLEDNEFESKEDLAVFFEMTLEELEEFLEENDDCLKIVELERI